MLSFLHTLLAHPIIPAFLFANLAIGFWAHRKAKVNSFEDYALASRSLPTGVLVMTLLGTLVSSGMLNSPTFIFSYGILEAVSRSCFAISFFIAGTLITPCLVYFQGCTTLGDLMRKLYGNTAQLVTGVIGCLMSLLLVIAQLRAIGPISKFLLGIDPSSAILCLGVITVLYSVWGGMRSVSYTDIFQAVGAFIVLGWLTQTLLQKVGGGGVLFHSLYKNYPHKLAILSHPAFYYKVKSTIFWYFSFTFLFTQPVVQRTLMVQDKRSVRKTWYIVGFLYLIMLMLITLIGLAPIIDKSQFGLTKERVDLLPYLIKTLFEKQPWVLDIMFVGLIGILISTIDSLFHAIGIAFIQDIVESTLILLKKNPLSTRRKSVYSRLSVLFVGILTVLIATRQGSTLFSKEIYIYSLLASGIFVTPLIIGLMGIKTDRISWYSFCTVYVSSLVVFYYHKWHTYDYFLLSLALGTLAYFLTHIIQNRGLVTLKRSELTVAERLWLPSWSGLEKKLMGFIKAPLQLPTLADRKVVGTPMHSLAFSMLIFALYTLSSIFSSGGVGTANFMAGIHFVGITLCCGLMLKGIWPARLKPYFPLYWFVSLFYCLPFGGTLAFLRLHEGPADVIFWVASFVLLAYLVDSTSFLVLEFLGVSLALGGWYLAHKALPADLWNGYVIVAVGTLLVNLLAILLFGRGKEARTNERLYWNRIASSILGHDLRGSTQMLGGAGNILEKTFEIGEPSTNGKGEKGYWLPFAQSQFLAQFSGDMSKKAASTRKEISNFLSFIQQQIMGTFEQEAVSMRAMAEEGIEKIGAKVKSSRIKLTLEATKDFEAKVLAGIFPNVIFNLLMNATTHGKASEVTITIDGNTRTITVRDNGQGITADVLPRIFDLSYSSAGHGKENAGVGLAFAKMVLDASGAKISCHSRVEKGSFTEFVMTFEEA